MACVSILRFKLLRIMYGFLFIIIAIPTIVACGGTWDLRSDKRDSKAGIKENQMAIIERHPTRSSPMIHIFKHLDLGIYKDAPGDIYRDAYSKNSVITPPGKVQVIVNLHREFFYYYPEIEFTALPKHTYFLTWVCKPYQYLAIADAQSEAIVAMDSYCPDCSGLIGHTLDSSTDCVHGTTWIGTAWSDYWASFAPPMASKDNQDVFIWGSVLAKQAARNLCFAADQGNANAMNRLGFFYGWGYPNFIERDPVRAYVWYNLALDAGGMESARHLEYFKKHELSENQTDQAERLLNDWRVGQCEQDLQAEPVFNLKLWFDTLPNPLTSGIDRIPALHI